jgi:hypothetical protein
MYISNHSRTRRALVWVALPLMVYVLAALFLTWPLPEHISSSTIDEGRSDVFMMVRGAWAANYALRAGHNPLNQSLIVYPNGFTSYMMWATPLRWLPGTLLMFLFSPLAAFNLWLIGTLVMNGVAAYWLGMELSGRHVAAALVGGIVFMAFPSMQGHLREAHIDVLAMYAQPLLALCLWRILYRAAGWRTVGWGGLWFALSCLGLVSQIIYNVLPLFLFMGLYHVIWRRDRLFPRDLPLRDQPWLKIGGMLLLGGLVLLIFFGPLMTNQGRAEMDAVGDATGRIKFSTDPLAFASPSPFGLIGKLGFGMDYAHDVLDTNLTEGAAYLGLVALVLAVVAVALRREARGWLVVALGSMIFSLGPLLKWHNQPVVFRVENTESYIELPFAALEDLPVINSTRTPGRFNGATALAWSALVSTGAGIAFGWFRRREVQIMLAAGLGAAILVEYQIFWPHEIRSTVQSAYFDQLAARDDSAIPPRTRPCWRS